MPLQKIADRVGHKGRTPGQQFEEHASERVEVAARVNAMAEDLLRRHVRGCARQGTGNLEHVPAFRAEPADQAEVHQHRPTVRAHEDVARLQIPVHDALLVKVCEWRAQPVREGQRFTELPRRDRRAGNNTPSEQDRTGVTGAQRRCRGVGVGVGVRPAGQAG